MSARHKTKQLQQSARNRDSVLPTKLKLYTLNDGGLGHCDWEEWWWMAVWAPTKSEAYLYALRNYSGGYCRDELEAALVISRVDEPTIAWPGPVLLPAQRGTHEERRMSTLRLAGWRFEGESECESCGLYANGDDRYRVCDSCYLCRECRTDNETCEDCEQ